MEEEQTTVGHNRIHLVRIRPADNERRFYVLEAGQDLFGPALVRQWGRIGGAFHQLITPFPTAGDAEKAMVKHLRKKCRRGYSEAK